MTTATAIPGNTADTFLTHIFGRGLEDDRYVVERFRAMADGDIRRLDGDGPVTAKSRRKARRVTATPKAVKELRPALNLKRSGIQYWGSISTGLFCAWTTGRPFLVTVDRIAKSTAPPDPAPAPSKALSAIVERMWLRAIHTSTVWTRRNGVTVRIDPFAARYSVSADGSKPMAIIASVTTSLPAAYQSCPVVSRSSARPGKRIAIDAAPATPRGIVRRKP